jgi:hypothetical protein
MRWTYADEVFAKRYARAKIEGMDVLAEWAVDEMADPNLPIERIQQAKYAFEARKWYVSKIAPLRYGDKLDVKQEITGPVQVDVLLNVLLTPANMERLTDVEVEAIRSAAAKLALPAPVIDAVAESSAGVASECALASTGELDDTEAAEEAADE